MRQVEEKEMREAVLIKKGGSGDRVKKSFVKK